MSTVKSARSSKTENRRRRVPSHAVDDILRTVKNVAWRGRRASSPVRADSASGLFRQPRTAVCRDGCLPVRRNPRYALAEEGFFPRMTRTGADTWRVNSARDPQFNPNFFHFLSCLENQRNVDAETPDSRRYFAAISRSYFYSRNEPTAKYCAQVRELLLTCLSVVDTPFTLSVMISHTSDKFPEQISQSRHCGQEGGVK